MLIPESVVTFLEPWSRVYGSSTLLSVAITFAHLSAMMIGGGLALSADRAVLRTDRHATASARSTMAQVVSDAHRPVMFALGTSAVSGALQFAADAETLASSRVFWVKAGLLVLLIANGLVMRIEERAVLRDAADSKSFGSLRVRAFTSVVLWLGITLAGVGLMQG